MVDIIILLIVALAISLSIGYIVKAKKRGQKCVGCSCSSCGGSCHK